MKPDILSAIAAAKHADWGQVVANGGPPCFHLEGVRFCLRAQRWDGHDSMHRYLPLHELLAAVAISADESGIIGVQACRPEDRAMLNTPAGRELLTKAVAAIGAPTARCTAMSPHHVPAIQCGLTEGHAGDHTVLIPTNAPWFK